MKVPNNQFGLTLIEQIRTTLNRESYQLRLRGSGIDEEKIGNIPKRRYWRHVPLKYAKDIRVYLYAKVETQDSYRVQKSRVMGIDTVKNLIVFRGW